MSPEAITAERVFQRLKGDLLLGRFALGAGINVHSLASEFDLSISPVRDALNRLVGEGVVEMRAGGGFQMPMLDELGLRNLYAWHGSLISWSLRPTNDYSGVAPLADLVAVSDEGNGSVFADVTASLFGWIGDRSDNLEHAAAVRKAADKLRAVRICETFLTGRKAELEAIVADICSGKVETLRRTIQTYHQRRVVHAKRLLAMRHVPSDHF